MINLKELIKNKRRIIKKNNKRENEINIFLLINIIEKQKKLKLFRDNILHTNKIENKKFFLNNNIEIKKNYLKKYNNKIKHIKNKINKSEKNISEKLLFIPNIISNKVPIGKDKTKNIVIRKIGKRKKFKFKIKNHIELAKITNTIDYKTAAEISGKGFLFYKEEGCALNRALINFITEYHKKKGDVEISCPYLVKNSSMIGTGQLPKFKEDVFITFLEEEKKNLFLIPTAEVPITNYFKNKIIKKLPIRIFSYSPCFRKEAGAHGKKDKGIIRLHQFEKIELVRLIKRKKAKKELFLIIKRTSEILKKLKIPHRIVLLCSGDLGFSSKLTYDIEAWFPGEKKYKEISSCSNFGTFQSRRINIKYKGKKKNKLVTTLNGSSLPLGRTIAAIYENSQLRNGNIKIPKILLNYVEKKKNN